MKKRVYKEEKKKKENKNPLKLFHATNKLVSYFGTLVTVSFSSTDGFPNPSGKVHERCRADQAHKQ